MGIHSYPVNNSIAQYNNVWNNTIDYDGIVPGPGSISADPLFVGGDPFSYELSEGSPCIDAGDPDSPLDPDGSRADMGAYAFGQASADTRFEIAHAGAAPGGAVSVPIAGYGLASRQIGGLEFHIAYDPALLTFTDISSDYVGDAEVNALDGVIHIVWEDFADPVELPDSAAILALNFTAGGPDGSTSPLTWQAGTEAVDAEGDVIAEITYVSGHVDIFIPHSIGGDVVYYDLVRGVADVTVLLSGDGAGQTTTEADGSYIIEGLAPGDYALEPSWGTGDNGVTVQDMVVLRRHLAYLERLDLPYKYVAGDVNASGYVSIADVVKIARYLAELESLPAGNWAFVDAGFEITEQNWPQAPSGRDVVLHNFDLGDIDFIGIRIGDVDNSWGGRRSKTMTPQLDDPGFYIEEVPGEPGGSVSMNVRVLEGVVAAGLEMHIGYPSDQLRLTGISSESIDEPILNSTEGMIHLVWCDIDNLANLAAEQSALCMTFEVLPGAPSFIPVEFVTAYTVDINGEEMGLLYTNGAVYRTTGISDLIPTTFGLEQNYPNPFNASTSIEFRLPEASRVSVEVYDVSGRRVATLADGRYEAGVHRVTWQGQAEDGAAASSGVYFYQLRAGFSEITHQMLMLK